MLLRLLKLGTLHAASRLTLVRSALGTWDLETDFDSLENSPRAKCGLPLPWFLCLVWTFKGHNVRFCPGLGDFADYRCRIQWQDTADFHREVIGEEQMMVSDARHSVIR